MFYIKLSLLLLLDLVLLAMLQYGLNYYLLFIFLIFNVQILNFLFTEFIYYLLFNIGRKFPILYVLWLDNSSHFFIQKYNLTIYKI